MPWKHQVKVIHAPDGNHIYQEIHGIFENSNDVEVYDEPDKIPQTHQAAVGVFILTDEAMKDHKLSESLEQLLENDFPVLPVVEDIDNYDFSKIPPSLKPLGKLNAVGWNEGSISGEKVLLTIKRYLGLIPFKRHCKLFISYCRSDGRDAAMEVHNFLHGKNYVTFLDTEDIEVAQDAQKTIMEAIPERDLILLVDSPGAAASKWVRDEIIRALRLSVTVCALRLSENRYFPLFREMPSIRWDKSAADRFDRLEKFIDGIIASKETFDMRCNRTVRKVADLLQCSIRRVHKRKLKLSKQIDSDQKNLLIEYEDAPPTLDRLYRLHTGYERSSDLNSAIFIHNGLPLSNLEQNAVNWAKGDEPLQALALTEVRKAVKFILET